MRLDHPLDDVLRDRSHVRVLRVLNALPTELGESTREVARRAGVSHPTASKVLGSLVTQGIVSVDRTLFADIYRLNRQHEIVRPLARLFDWERHLFDEVLDLLGREIRRHAPYVIEAYLFGSAARREMEPGSDVDVAVVCPRHATETVEADLEPLRVLIRDRFGARLSLLIGSDPVSTRGTARRGAWRHVASEGVPLIPKELRDRDGKSKGSPSEQKRRSGLSRQG